LSAAVLGAAAFVALFVIISFLGLPIPLNFLTAVVGALLGWYLPGRALTSDPKRATERHK
jgi:hypothetical protein